MYQLFLFLSLRPFLSLSISLSLFQSLYHSLAQASPHIHRMIIGVFRFRVQIFTVENHLIDKFRGSRAFQPQHEMAKLSENQSLFFPSHRF